jgi:hypothetical protein
VAPEPALETCFSRTAPYHLTGIGPMHREIRQLVGPAGRRAEEGSLLLIVDAGRGEVFVEVLLELVVRRHLVNLAAFLLQTKPPALAIWEVILDARGDDGADAGKGIDHHTDERSIAQTDEEGHFRF